MDFATFLRRTGRNLRKARWRRGLTQQDVAAEGFTYRYLQEIERFCATRQVAYIGADVTVPFDELILRVFRRGGFLR